MKPIKDNTENNVAMGVFKGIIAAVIVIVAVVWLFFAVIRADNANDLTPEEISQQLG